MNRRPNRQARRKPLREAHAAAVQAAGRELARRMLLDRPPRAELPVSTGRWRSLPDPRFNDQVYEVDFAPTPRPTSPIWQVPIMPTALEREAMNFAGASGWAGAADRRVGTIDMRAVQWGLTAGTTRLRWWNWEPVKPQTDTEAVAYRMAQGAHAMMTRLRPHVQMLAEIDPNGTRYGFGVFEGQEHGWPLPGDVALRYWDESVDMLGAWLGLVRTRYTVPGLEVEFEERVSEARRP